MSPPQKPLGLRREVLLFLPTAVFLLVVIASFNLLAYRNALRETETERIATATDLAARAAADLSAGSTLSADRVTDLVPVATAAAVHGSEGRRSSRSGAPLELDLERLIGEPRPSRPIGFGPSALDASRVVALAPFEMEGRPYYLQIDLDAEGLTKHLAGLERLLVLNAVVLGTLTLLVLLFLRHLLRPYESLLESARRLDESPEAAVDEAQFLIQTFDRALEALQRPEPEEVDDIAVLERTLAPSLESGFMLLDSAGAVLSINDLGARLLGIESEPRRAPLETLLSPHRELSAIIAEAVRDDATIQRRECEIGPPDEQLLLGLTIHPLRRADRSVRGFIVLFTDLTSVRAQARQAEISRSLSQLGEIAAGVAHEMRNGLGTLKGYLTLMELNPEQEPVRDYLAEMRVESEHLERVVTDFLSFARPGSLRTEALDLAELATRAAADPALAEAAFDLSVPAAPLKLSGDPQLLDRALRNLLQNAHEAQRDAGSEEAIRVRVWRQGNEALIDIDDSGAGLPPEIRESLFQPFVSGRPDGVGLGLTLAHRIVELHGGELTIDSSGSDGTRVRLRLPVTIDT